MSKELLQQLLDDYVTGTISPGDRQQLLSYLEDPDMSQYAETFLLSDLQAGRYDSEDIPSIRDQLHTHLTERINSFPAATPVRRFHFIRTDWFKYAAAVLIICGIGAYLWTSKNNSALPPASTNIAMQSDVVPGGEKAMLTLADGSTIILENAARGNLATQGSAQIVKLSSGEIAYKTKRSAEKEVMWNTMSTPAGGQYKVTLPDGTKAWLNASSSITYPAAFVSMNREVKVTGEVYFEVEKNKEKPFIVDIDGKSIIEVLGTSFNINSYANEEAMKTTLLGGSIKVIRGKSTMYASEQPVILKPGQQAVAISADAKLKLIDANIEQVMAWKNGIFDFNGSDLKSVMRQLERWYNIEVKYRESVNNITFQGRMYRNLKLSDVLEALQKMGVRFQMEGKILTVL